MNDCFTWLLEAILVRLEYFCTTKVFTAHELLFRQSGKVCLKIAPTGICFLVLFLSALVHRTISGSVFHLADSCNCMNKRMTWHIRVSLMNAGFLCPSSSDKAEKAGHPACRSDSKNDRTGLVPLIVLRLEECDTCQQLDHSALWWPHKGLKYLSLLCPWVVDRQTYFIIVQNVLCFSDAKQERSGFQFADETLS